MKRTRHPSTLDHIDLELIANYVRHANGGNPRSALVLLSLFSQQVRRGEQVEDALLEFVTTAFEDILSGVKPRKALRLTREHKRPIENLGRDLHIAVKVTRKMRDGMSLFNSALEVGEEFGLHESRIQDIYSKYKKIALQQIDAGIVVP